MTAPKAPSSLSRESAKLWQTICTDYDFTDADHKILEASLCALDDFNHCLGILRREGLTFTNRHGEPRMRPEYAAMRDSRLHFLRGVRELALDGRPEVEEYTRPTELRGLIGGRS